MAKKNFTGGIDSLIAGTTQNDAPFSSAMSTKRDNRNNDDAQLVRANFVMNPRLHKELKQVALDEGKKLKDVLAEAIEMYLASKK